MKGELKGELKALEWGWKVILEVLILNFFLDIYIFVLVYLFDCYIILFNQQFTFVIN